MRRPFRLFEKKRGHRRTGSKLLGSLGEALFFGFFLCIGVAGLTALLTWLVIPEWRANRHFSQTECLVLDKRLDVSDGDEGSAYRPQIHIRYEVDGRRYELTTYDITGMYTSSRATAEAQLAEIDVGRQYYCWYDPINPARAVVVRGYSGGLYLLLLIPVSFIAIGGGGLVYAVVHWNASAERRAAIAQHRAQVDLFEANVPTNPDFPTIPADDNLTNSPGIHLAYRLPVAAAEGWTLFATLLATLVWNGVVVMFAVMAVQAHLAGAPDWFLTLFLLPLGGIGVALAVYLARRIWRATAMGPTQIEISDHPLNPGEAYELAIAQSGGRALELLELALVCEEKATYNQGTDTRTEVRQVHEELVFRDLSPAAEPGPPRQRLCTLRVPETAMHSFKADHNEVNWSLVVRGRVAGWPPYERRFPVIVYPGQHGTGA